MESMLYFHRERISRQTRFVYQYFLLYTIKIFGLFIENITGWHLRIVGFFAYNCREHVRGRGRVGEKGKFG